MVWRQPIEKQRIANGGIDPLAEMLAPGAVLDDRTQNGSQPP